MPRQTFKKKQRGGGMSVVGGDGNSFNGYKYTKRWWQKKSSNLAKTSKNRDKTKRKSRKGGNPAFFNTIVLYNDH